eukprot:9271668-Pyramimonas_sp.AAC.1
MEVHELSRVEVKKLCSKSFHHRALGVVLDRVLGVGYSAQDAGASTLKTTSCGPTVPHCAENRRLHPRGHQ